MSLSLEQLIFETQQQVMDDNPDLTNDQARRVAIDQIGVTA